MFKIIALVCGVVFLVGAQTRTATESFVTNRVSLVSAQINAVSGRVDSVVSAVGVVSGRVDSVASAVGVLETARVDRVWGSVANYTDAAGVMWEIVQVNVVDFVFPDNGTIGAFLTPDPYLWTFAAPATTDEATFVLNNNWQIWFQPEGGADVTIDARMTANSGTRWYALAGVSELGQDVILYPYDTVNQEWISYEIGVNTIAVDWRSFAQTNAIDKVVTTNGTVIIIGDASDSTGSVTQLVAMAGSQEVKFDFFGRSEAEAAIAAIPLPPTNAVSGWLLYDSGSNVWLQVSVSNFSFTVHEVIQ